MVRTWFSDVLLPRQNKSPQPDYSTCKLFWLKKVSEKSNSLTNFWCRLLSIQYLYLLTRLQLNGCSNFQPFLWPNPLKGRLNGSFYHTRSILKIQLYWRMASLSLQGPCSGIIISQPASQPPYHLHWYGNFWHNQPSLTFLPTSLSKRQISSFHHFPPLF